MRLYTHWMHSRQSTLNITHKTMRPQRLAENLHVNPVDQLSVEHHCFASKQKYMCDVLDVCKIQNIVCGRLAKPHNTCASAANVLICVVIDMLAAGTAGSADILTTIRKKRGGKAASRTRVTLPLEHNFLPTRSERR